MSAGREPLRSECDPQEEEVRCKQARKSKHVEGDMGQLQKQMHSMQETLNNLLEAQQLAVEPQDLGLPLSKRPCSHPDELSVAASGVFGRDNNYVPSEQEDISESETGDSASEAIALDPSDKAVISRAAECAKLPSQAAATSTSVFDRGHQRRKSEGLPILPDFMSKLQSSWNAPSSTSLPWTQLGNLAGAATYGLATAPQIGPTFAMLNGAMTRIGNATHPNKHGRIIDSQLRKALSCLCLVCKTGMHKLSPLGLFRGSTAGFVLHFDRGRKHPRNFASG